MAKGVGRSIRSLNRLKFMCVWWGAVAQLGERLVRNEEVSGSIPLSSTKDSTTRGNHSR